jgi:hypothetical protein
MNDKNASHGEQLIFRRFEEPFNFMGEHPGTTWGWIIGLILLVGIVYVIWMYVRDGKSVGWYWGVLLGLLRIMTYSVITIVFLLPATRPHSETRQQSRVLVLDDCSASMLRTKDDIPSDAVPFEKLPSRQDGVVAFMNQGNPAFFPRLMEKNPVHLYRFGSGLDENFLLMRDGKVWSREEAEANAKSENEDKKLPGRDFTAEEIGKILKPNLDFIPPADASPEDRLEAERIKRLFSSTNVSDSVYGLINKEANNMVQGLVVFTDGRSTEGAAAGSNNRSDAFNEITERAKRAKLPIFVVVVGKDREPTKIDIADVRGPDQARPEDPFRVTANVTGQGLGDKDVNIFVDVYKPGPDGKAVQIGKEQPFKTIEKKVKFKKAALPVAEAEYKFDPTSDEGFGDIPTGKPAEKPMKPGDKPEASPPGSGKPEFKEGEWQFVVRVPKDKAEITPVKEHVSSPVVVRVVKRPLRVLLFASAATRDYQFIRTMMVRESEKRRVDLAIYLQPIPGQPRRGNLVQDVPPDRLLVQFPNKMSSDSKEDPLYNLANYDVIIGFDPDWSELTKEQAKLVENWVKQQGGGLIIVAGPIHTLELARPGGAGVRAGADPERLRPILDLYPVILKDARVDSKERDTSIPVRLNFRGASPELEFLRLDDDPKTGLLDAWNEFFLGPKGSGEKAPLRGVYGYYPVKQAKDNAITVATFGDKNAADPAGNEPPYLVIGNSSAGKVVWLGSGETWRLRQFREVWHERFWTKLIRYTAAGSTGGGNRRIKPNMGKEFSVRSEIVVEAQLFDKNLKPLGVNGKGIIQIDKVPPGVNEKEIEKSITMLPKPGGDEGWFIGKFYVKTPGPYSISIKIDDGSNETSPALDFKTFALDPELENTRIDMEAVRALASDADDVMARVDDTTRAKLRTALQRYKPTRSSTADKPVAGGEAPPPEKESYKLIFDLSTAEVIPDCMLKRENVQENLGSATDLWDTKLPWKKGPLFPLNEGWYGIDIYLYHFLYGVSVFFAGLSLIVGIGALISLAMGQSGRGALIACAILAGVTLLALLAGWLVHHEYIGKAAWPMSLILSVIVLLLGAEWMLRKLLRLA